MKKHSKYQSCFSFIFPQLRKIQENHTGNDRPKKQWNVWNSNYSGLYKHSLHAEQIFLIPQERLRIFL